MFCCLFFFFFKQKTAYEMRISDWSSDVCSSDLLVEHVVDADGDFGEVADVRRTRQVDVAGGFQLTISQAALAGVAAEQLVTEQVAVLVGVVQRAEVDRKSTRLNSSH